MANTSDLVKEEFTQSYLQVRWLDGTRTKFLDRFFILCAAILVARFQYADFLQKDWGWLLSMHVLFSVTLVALARTIILFRRQQRGHRRYIKSLRASIFSNILDPPGQPDFANPDVELVREYSRYLNGRKIYLTTWIELIVIFIASSSAFLLTDLANIVPFLSHCPRWIVYVVSAFIWMYIFYRLFLPWKCYNFREKISWNNE